MGKITNNYNLPEPLYKAICNDTYVKRGDISVTALIDGSRIRQLKKKHWQEIEEDAVDLIWALFGQANHAIIERACEGNDNYLAEEKLEMAVFGKILSGTADLYDKEKKILYDFKTTSVWGLVLNDDHWQWEAQTNCYAHMLRQQGYEINEIKIIAILRDWKRSEAERNYPGSNYPLKQVEEVAITVYSDKAMQDYIEKRMKMHIDAENGNILDCSDKERWAKPDAFAVIDPKQKRAKKICKSLEDAEGYIRYLEVKKYKGELFIETRKGSNVKCEGFCSVAQFCPQFAKMKKNGV